MSDTAMPLPTFKRMAAVLRKTTESLAQELSAPSDTAPQWSELEWRVAQAVAALHGISALLATTLKWQGPQQWQAFLAEQKSHTLLRQRRIAELLAQIHSRARRTGIGMVGLKGAALLEMGVYQPGERPMGDIDLLAHPRDLPASAQVLVAVGYLESFTTWRHKVFAPPASRDCVGFGEHVDNPLKIELHTQIAERLPIVETNITALTLLPQLQPGLNAYPSAAALMRHLLLHAAGNLRARALRLIQLHDIALLARRMGDADWQELSGVGAMELGSWWALPPLLLTARYYPAAIPAAVIETVAADCPWWLQRVSRRHRLTDVSWSKIRIQAFPGIEWSKSAREALLFVLSRARPSRAALADLRMAPTMQPSLTCVPWYELPHSARILRWIFSRPPRVQTMFSIRSALGHGPQ